MHAVHLRGQATPGFVRATTIMVPIVLGLAFWTAFTLEGDVVEGFAVRSPVRADVAGLGTRGADRRLGPAQPRALHRPRRLGASNRVGAERTLAGRTGTHGRRRSPDRPRRSPRSASSFGALASGPLRRRPGARTLVPRHAETPGPAAGRDHDGIPDRRGDSGRALRVALAVSIDDPVGGRDRSLSSDPTFWLRIVIGFGLHAAVRLDGLDDRPDALDDGRDRPPLPHDRRRPRRPDRSQSPDARQRPVRSRVRVRAPQSSAGQHRNSGLLDHVLLGHIQIQPRRQLRDHRRLRLPTRSRLDRADPSHLAGSPPPSSRPTRSGSDRRRDTRAHAAPPT